MLVSENADWTMIVFEDPVTQLTPNEPGEVQVKVVDVAVRMTGREGRGKWGEGVVEGQNLPLGNTSTRRLANGHEIWVRWQAETQLGA